MNRIDAIWVVIFNATYSGLFPVLTSSFLGDFSGSLWGVYAVTYYMILYQIKQYAISLSAPYLHERYYRRKQNGYALYRRL